MKFVFTTPKWFDTIYFTTRYAKNSIKWILSPYRCSECGEVMNTKSVEVRYNTGNNAADRWGASSSAYKKPLTCKHCIAKKIRADSASLGIMSHELGDYDVADKCDRCHKDVHSQKFYSNAEGTIDVRILNRWWNGAFICKDCCADIFEFGELTASIFTMFNGKYVGVLNNGLYLIDGKVKLFAKVSR